MSMTTHPQQKRSLRVGTIGPKDTGKTTLTEAIAFTLSGVRQQPSMLTPLRSSWHLHYESAHHRFEHLDFTDKKRSSQLGKDRVDVAYFVIAADQPMLKGALDPSRVRVENAGRVVVALTKVDLVNPQDVPGIRHALRDELERVGLGAVPIIPVSARDALASDEDASRGIVELVSAATADATLLTPTAANTSLGAAPLQLAADAQAAVREELVRKRRDGEPAYVWRDGQVVEIPAHQLPD